MLDVWEMEQGQERGGQVQLVFQTVTGPDEGQMGAGTTEPNPGDRNLLNS